MAMQPSATQGLSRSPIRAAFQKTPTKLFAEIGEIGEIGERGRGRVSVRSLARDEGTYTYFKGGRGVDRPVSTYVLYICDGPSLFECHVALCDLWLELSIFIVCGSVPRSLH